MELNSRIRTAEPICNQIVSTCGSDECRKPRIALYSHDTMGLGHLRRNLLIACSLADHPIDAEVLLISGAKEACHFALRCGVDAVTLPALAKDLNGNYSGRHLRWNCQSTTELRSKIIAATLDAFDPNLFIVDNVPRGTRNELDRSLSALRQRRSTQCILGLRDILDDPEVVEQQWVERDTRRVIERHFDETWIYGDPFVYDTISNYSFDTRGMNQTIYTGYLDQRQRLSSPLPALEGAETEKSIVLCVVGGGQDGGALAKAFAAATIPRDSHGVLITGPYMPSDDRSEIRRLTADRDDITLIENMVEADQYIAIADRVVAMGGYNTTCSILSFEKASLLVPRITPRREQWIRAERLSDLGLLTAIKPNDLDSRAVTTWLHTESVPTAKNHEIDMLGIHRITDRVSHYVAPTRQQRQVQISGVKVG